MRKLKDLTEQQLEAFETLGFALADELMALFYLESEGFGDFKVTELANITLEFLEQKRKEA